MKTKIFSILISAAAMAGFSACDTWEPGPDVVNGQGQLDTASLGVNVDDAETLVADNSAAKPAAAKAAKGVASRATVDLTNFIVTVTDNNNQQVSRWTYTTMPELPTFAAGDYTVTVKSHEVEPAAWNAPYFEGSQKFTIEADKVTEVETVVCTLANIRVSVKFTDRLVSAFDNPAEVSVKITSEGNNSLVFTPAETRSGYFAALKDLETLRLDFSASIMGHTETFTKTIDNVAKGQHRKITLGLTGNDNLPPEELGTIINDGQGITVDTSVIEDAPIESDYPWYEDNLDNTGRPGDEDFDDGGEEPNPPTPPGPGDEGSIEFDDPERTTLDIDGVNMVDDYGPGVKDAIVFIKSTNGFAHLNVKIESNMLTDEFLMPVGLVSEFDLASPPTYEYDGETRDTTDGLKGLGFPVGNEVTGDGVIEIPFDITQFVPLIFESGDHKFHITVTDKKGNTKSMTLLLRK